MTAYRDRMIAGEHDAKTRGTKASKAKAKAAEDKRAGKTTTSKNVAGLKG